MTAHHTVLVSNIIGVERNEYTVPTAPAEDAPRALQSMWETGRDARTGNSPFSGEWLHDSQMDLHDIHIGYSSAISLQERAWAEQLYQACAMKCKSRLDPQNRAHRPIIDELQERMADKMYVNFSLFQSMPDAWGIDQLFPVGRWKGWIKCRNVALCCWILPVTLTVLSTTILMVTVLPRQCQCRSTIQRIRRCWFLYGRRISADPRQHAQPVR
ncbi:hypothetical protein ACLK15_17050 [Escherichia coli]